MFLSHFTSNFIPHFLHSLDWFEGNYPDISWELAWTACGFSSNPSDSFIQNPFGTHRPDLLRRPTGTGEMRLELSLLPQCALRFRDAPRTTVTTFKGRQPPRGHFFFGERPQMLKQWMI